MVWREEEREGGGEADVPQRQFRDQSDRVRGSKREKGKLRQKPRTMGPHRSELVRRQNVGETKGGPGGEAESPVPLIFQIISQEHPALLSLLFDGTPKWEGHQLDLRKNFPEEWGLLVSGRSWGFPSPSALIAKMLQGGGEGIRQMGAPPPPSQCHLLVSSQVPTRGQDYPLRSRPPQMTSLPAWA